MSTPSSAAPASTSPSPKFCPIEWMQEQAKPYLAPYYLTVAAVLGAITGGFVIVFVLLALVATNFNVLSWVE